MTKHWILIANAANARLLEREPRGRLALLRTFEHPASRLRNAQLGGGASGREPNGRGWGGSAYAPKLDAHHKEHLRFARELAEELEDAARHDRFGSLMIFACSPFLGELKHQLGDVTRRLLTEKHDVDLTRVGLAELDRRIAYERTQPH